MEALNVLSSSGWGLCCCAGDRSVLLLSPEAEPTNALSWQAWEAPGRVLEMPGRALQGPGSAE